MRPILKLIRWFVRALIIGTAVAAILGFFGFLVPAFDLFNHLQLLIFGALVAGVVLSPLLFRPAWRFWPWLGLLGFGLAASAFIMVPEIVPALTVQPTMAEDGRPVVKIMTHNILGDNSDMARIAAVVKEEDPDILALQEFFPYQRRMLDPLLKADYPYSVHCAGGRRAYIGLYAKMPFTETMAGACSAEPEKGQRTARILAQFTLADGTRFSVMTTHLDWPVPIGRQEGQFADLETAVKQVQGPLVLVGDFNSTSWSYALRDFASDAGLTRRDHNILTYPMLFLFDTWRPTWPFLTLDHVMTRGMDVDKLQAGPATGSDHLPIVFNAWVPRRTD